MKKIYWLLFIIFINCAINPQFTTKSDKYYIVKKNDNLTLISQKNNIPVNKLKLYNNLKNDKIYIGQKIYLSPNIPEEHHFITQKKIPKKGYYILKKGENLLFVEKKFNVDLIDLINWNDSPNLNPPAGTKIFLKFTKVKNIPQKKDKKQKYHTVEKGDNLTKIAKKNNLSVSKIKQWNNLRSDLIFVGQKLYFYQQKNTSPPLPPKIQPKKENKKIVKKKQKKIKTPSSSSPKISKRKVHLPVEGVVTSEFGLRNGVPHKGIDIAAKTGTPIKAARSGTVIYVGKQKGYGNVVILKHKNKIITIYAHNNTNLVRKNDVVIEGQPIATVGSTGKSTGPHLHFEYRIDGKAINPRKILPKF